MNILPLICSLLLILGFASSTLLRQRFATEWEGSGHIGFMRAERKARNALARKQYRKVKAIKAPSPSNHNSGESKAAVYASRREGQCLSPFAKLNLMPLLSETKSTSYALLYETAAHLLRLLYKNKLFPNDALEYRLLDEVLSAARTKSKASTLTSLFPEEPQLRELYYKMLKGTVNNYPPLADYFTLNRKEKNTAIHFRFAPKPLLFALFGEKITETILLKEKTKWEEDPKHRHHTITKAELETLVLENTSSRLNLSAIHEFSNYSGKEAAYPVVLGKDNDTGITVRKKI